MKAGKFIPAIFLAVIIVAIVWGVILHNNSGASTAKVTNTVVKAPLQKGLYKLEYKVVFGEFAKEIMGINGSNYVIVLNGIFNYPPTNVSPGTYTLISISGNVTFTNNSRANFIIPLYQEIKISSTNSEKFYIALQGNSPAIVGVYNYLNVPKE